MKGNKIKSEIFIQVQNLPRTLPGSMTLLQPKKMLKQIRISFLSQIQLKKPKHFRYTLEISLR